jgi:transposase
MRHRHHVQDGDVKGIWKVADLIGVVHNPDHRRLPPAAREALLELVGQVEALRQRIEHPDTAMVRRTRTYEAARRLATIPGVGAITASALQAFVPDPNGFGSG